MKYDNDYTYVHAYIHTMAVSKIRGLAAVRHCYAEGGITTPPPHTHTHTHTHQLPTFVSRNFNYVFCLNIYFKQLL